MVDRIKEKYKGLSFESIRARSFKESYPEVRGDIWTNKTTGNEYYVKIDELGRHFILVSTGWKPISLYTLESGYRK